MRGCHATVLAREYSLTNDLAFVQYFALHCSICGEMIFDPCVCLAASRCCDEFASFAKIHGMCCML